MASQTSGGLPASGHDPLHPHDLIDHDPAHQANGSADRHEESITRRPEAAPPATTGGTTAQGTNVDGPNKWVVLGILACGVFMSTLDSSIVNISLPAIAHYFKVPLSGSVEWVIIAYLVIIAAILLSIGRLADMIGRKPLWVAGLLIFTLGSTICGLSPTLGFLVAARAFQGIGGALLFAVSPAMLTAAFPAEERGRALGYNALIVALGVSVGPTVGGLLTQYFTWRWIFYVNVPIGIVAVVLSWRVLRERHQRAPSQFDPLGAILLAIGLGSLTLDLSFGQEWGWTSGGVLALGGVAIVALVAFILTEQRVAAPVVDLQLFRNRLFSSANISLLISFLALFAVSFLLPFYYEELRGFEIIKSGLLLTPLPITIAVVAPFSGRLADRFGTRWLAAGGLTIATIGLVLLSTITPQSSVFDLIWRLVLIGLGQALFQSPNNSALMGSAPRGRQGVASGMLATGRVIGQSLSVALVGAIFTGFGSAAAGQRLVLGSAHDPQVVAALQQTFIAGFHAAFLVCAAICSVGILTSLVRGNDQKARQKG